MIGGIGLSEKDFEMYKFIIRYIKDNGYAPTIREIGKAVHLSSTSNVITHLNYLERDGWIKIKPNSPRAIKVMGYEFRKVEN